MAHHVGVSGTLHDGRDGLHLVADDCPSDDCYEMATADAVGATAEEKAEDLTEKAESDAMPVVAEVQDGVIGFTYGSG